MLKNYELLYIVHPDLEGTTDKVAEKVAHFIEKADGKIINQEDWGKRKLAYPISRNDFGVYVLVQFEAESTKLTDIERNLRLSEEVMRSMVVALPEIKEKPAAKLKAVKKDKPAATEETEEQVSQAVEAEIATEVTEEKAPAKKPAVKAVKKEKAEKPKAVAKTKKETAKAEKPKADEASVSSEQEEKKRLKALDEKLEEILRDK